MMFCVRAFVLSVCLTVGNMFRLLNGIEVYLRVKLTKGSVILISVSTDDRPIARMYDLAD